MLLPLLIVVVSASTTGASADPAFRDRWLKAASKFSAYAHPLKSQFIQHLNQITEDPEIILTTDCRHGLRNFSAGLLSHRFKDMAMFDSFSKVHPGMLSFQGYDLGSYDQCLEHGRYVYLGIEFPVPKNVNVRKFKQRTGEDDWKIDYSQGLGIRRIEGFHFGICVPDACKEKDVESVFGSNHVNQLIKPLTVTIHTTDSKSDPVTRSWLQVVAMTALLVILGTGIFSAAINYVSPDSSMAQSLQAFDVLSNAKHLVSAPKQESMFVTVNLFRMVYIFGGIFAHSAVGTNFGTQLTRVEVMMGLGMILYVCANLHTY